MKRFFSNELLDNKYVKENILLRVISEPKINGDMKSYVKKFINLKVFPYVNSMYGKLLESFYDELSSDEKIEILNILKKQISEIDDTVKKQLMSSTKKNICDNLGIKNSITKTKKSIYSSIKGGQYGEMFLNYLFISLGYEKIMSKLYLEWGPLSPTGIDAPYIDIKNDILVLGESKLYKDISLAIDSVMKDLNSIYCLDKLDKEVIEWNCKFNMIPEDLRNYIKRNEIKTKRDLINKMNKIIIIGMVMGDWNKNIELRIKRKLNELTDYNKIEKFELALIVIPLDSKDTFVEYCMDVINDMIKEIGENNE